MQESIASPTNGVSTGGSAFIAITGTCSLDYSIAKMASDLNENVQLGHVAERVAAHEAVVKS